MKEEDDIKHLEESIKSGFELISKHYYSYFFNRAYGEFDLDPYDNANYEGQVSLAIVNLYNQIICYFEMKGLDYYLKRFINKFEKTIDESKTLAKFGPCIPVGIDGFEEDFYILEEFKAFLFSFKFFSHPNDEKFFFDLKLIEALRETNVMLSIGKTIVNKETDISNKVSDILILFFPSIKKISKNSGSTFIQEYKTYYPDILVPSLKTAIEYKYIKVDSVKTPDDYIDEVYIDSQNYKGDEKYNKFIAVLCLQKGVIYTKKKLLQCWKQKQFPHNWIIIIIQDV
jgi:hypothetical protein